MLKLLLLGPLIVIVSLEVPLDLRDLNDGRPPLQDTVWYLLVSDLLSTTYIILVDGQL